MISSQFPITWSDRDIPSKYINKNIIHIWSLIGIHLILTESKTTWLGGTSLLINTIKVKFIIKNLGFIYLKCHKTEGSISPGSDKLMQTGFPTLSAVEFPDCLGSQFPHVSHNTQWPDQAGTVVADGQLNLRDTRWSAASLITILPQRVGNCIRFLKWTNRLCVFTEDSLKIDCFRCKSTKKLFIWSTTCHVWCNYIFWLE